MSRFQSRTRVVRFLQRLNWMKTPNPKNRSKKPQTATLMKKMRKSLSQKWLGRLLRWKINKINNKNSMLFLRNQAFLGWNWRPYLLPFKKISLWELYWKVSWKMRSYYLVNKKSKRKKMIPWFLGFKTSPNTVNLLKNLKRKTTLSSKKTKMEKG